MAGYTQHWDCRICNGHTESDGVPKHHVCAECLMQIAKLLCNESLGKPIDTPGIDKSYWMRRADEYVRALMRRWKALSGREGVIAPSEVRPIGKEM